RGQVTLSVRFEGLVWIEELIQLVESSASAELYSLLKRPDEKAVTERAYEHPVFVEDLVRNIAIKANADSRITWYRVEAENYESIHNHNAYAMIEKGCGVTVIAAALSQLANPRGFSVAAGGFGNSFAARFLTRVGSSMVEQHPFKALVVGSSPTQPTPPFLL